MISAIRTMLRTVLTFVQHALPWRVFMVDRLLLK